MSGFAFLFPGQGSQCPGMGKGLYREFSESREVFERADSALGFSLSRICFEGNEDDLARTEITQPAILTVSVAAARALEARGIRPLAAAGHSLGEYSAHVVAGTIPFEDAVRAVHLRGRFMQEAVPLGIGAMAAILGLDAAEVERVCGEAAGGEVVAIANHNGGGQIVIAGHKAAVDRACALALGAGARRAVPLSVSAPFHCVLMEPARERLRPVLNAIPFADPVVPVFANVDASPVADGAAAREALLRQVASPVLWEETVRRMALSGLGRFVEAGPGRVLAGLVRRISRESDVAPASAPEEILEVAAKAGGPA